MGDREFPDFGTACVLAGGLGRRMCGVDKLGLRLGGERLLERLARSLSARFLDLVAVSGRPEALDGLGFRVVPDLYPGAGPAGGLHAGLVAARSRWVYLVACDMPGYEADWVDALRGAIEAAEASGGGPLAALGEDRPYLQPFHAFYERSLAPLVAERLESPSSKPSLQELVRSARYIGVPAGAYVDRGLFESLDTQADLAGFDIRQAAAHTGPRRPCGADSDIKEPCVE